MKIPLAQRLSTPCDFNAGRGRTSLDWVALKGQTITTTESQKPNAPADSGSTTPQQIGALCDPSKGASGKTADGTPLQCNAGSDGKSYWQLK